MNAVHPVGRPAAFDRTKSRRHSMIGKIHVARKELMMDEDDYRQILLDETSKHSLTECSDTELEKVIARLKKLGFKPLPSRFGKATAQHPMARKARALWISLYHLGVVRNGSEEALEAFATRQLGCERLVWARQSDAYKLIEALKQMAERAGWRQTADPVTGQGRSRAGNRGLSPMLLQRGLCEQILHRLKEAQIAHPNWTLADAAWRLCGLRLPELVTPPGEQAETFNRIATALGRQLRDALPNIATAEEDAK